MLPRRTASASHLKVVKASIDSIVDEPEEQWKPAVDTVKAQLHANTRSPSYFATTPTRPGLGPQRPSWIGPQPLHSAATSSGSVMKQTVRVRYAAPGLQPPVFISTTMSTPPWDPVEMEAEKTGETSWHFQKTFTTEIGGHQYKFRLGHGEWWVCDTTKPTVDDGCGNTNNMMVVTGQPFAVQNSGTTSVIATSPARQTPQVDTATPSFNATLKSPALMSTSEAPLFDHEKLGMDVKSDGSTTPPLPKHNDDNMRTGPISDTPLLQHEQFHAPSIQASSPHHDIDTWADEEGWVGDTEEEAPLLRHESITLHSPPSPRRDLDRRGNSRGPMPTNSQPFVLEYFPTDHAGIIETIRRASMELPEDITSSDSSVSREISLSSVIEMDEEDEKDDEDYKTDEDMKRLHQIEEEEAQREAAEDDLDPLTSFQTPEEVPMVEVAEDKRGRGREQELDMMSAPMRGVLDTVAEVMSHPIYWLAVVGIALGIAAGTYKLRQV